MTASAEPDGSIMIALPWPPGYEPGRNKGPSHRIKDSEAHQTLSADVHRDWRSVMGLPVCLAD